jgi:hypothetical protein
MIIGGLTWYGLAAAFTKGSMSNWDPLTVISHELDCQFYGSHAGGHHLTNVLLHTASVVLLFLVLCRMTGARWRSAFAAAVFGIHPLRAESVAWVTERKDVLSRLFLMLTLWAYVRYIRQPRRLKNYLLVMIFFVLGLMSKSMLVTMPLVLLLLDYWPLRRNAELGVRSAESGEEQRRTLSWAKLILEKIPLLALSVGFGMVALWAQGRGHAVQALAEYPFPLRMVNALDSVLMYLAQMFFPLNLAAFYPYPDHGLAPWRTGVALVAVLGISVLAWRGRGRRPYVLTGWLWNLVMLAPVIGLIQLGDQARADRYT